jgi:CheY-like chemotaxis protein
MTAELKTVLLVDDEPANIQIVNSILRDTYKTRIAMNGAKALQIANQVPPPDLILLDVMMPEMDGYEVCTCLKLGDQTRDIPVIFLNHLKLIKHLPTARVGAGGE